MPSPGVLRTVRRVINKCVRIVPLRRVYLMHGREKGLVNLPNNHELKGSIVTKAFFLTKSDPTDNFYSLAPRRVSL